MKGAAVDSAALFCAPVINRSTVIVRESGRSSTPWPLGSSFDGGDYWMPAFAGMTREVLFPASLSASRGIAEPE